MRRSENLLLCAGLVCIALIQVAQAGHEHQLPDGFQGPIGRQLGRKSPLSAKILKKINVFNLKRRQEAKKERRERELAEATRLKESHEGNLKELTSRGHRDIHESAIKGEFLLKLEALKDEPRDGLLKGVSDILQESQWEGTPLVGGLNAHNMLALMAVGRQHCNKDEFQRRRDTCSRLAEQPTLSAFCTEANELSRNWCERPVSIESPFANLADSNEPLDSPEETEAKLRSLAGEVNPRRLHYRFLHPWQQTATFDGVYRILKRAQDKRQESIEPNDFDTLDLASVDESKCTREELRERRYACWRYPNREVENFCIEAFERTKEWCSKSGFFEHILGHEFHEYHSKLGVRLITKFWQSLDRANPSGRSHDQLLGWQNRQVYETLRQFLLSFDDSGEANWLVQENRRQPLAWSPNMTREDLLALDGIQKERCTKEELERRHELCRTLQSHEIGRTNSLRIFCLEAHKNSVDFCEG